MREGEVKVEKESWRKKRICVSLLLLSLSRDTTVMKGDRQLHILHSMLVVFSGNVPYEQLCEPRQRVLIHRVDISEVSDHKI